MSEALSLLDCFWSLQLLRVRTLLFSGCDAIGYAKSDVLPWSLQLLRVRTLLFSGCDAIGYAKSDVLPACGARFWLGA